MKKDIICFTESLAGGGAEHQIAILAGLLKEKGYNVTLATYADVPDHYDLPEGVNRVVIAPHKNQFQKFLAVFKFFLKTEADCVISYRKMCNIRALIPLFFRRAPIKMVCSERNFTTGKPDFSRRLMTKVLYKKADYIVPNSSSQTEYMKKENPKNAPKLRTIYNYTDLEQFCMSPMPVNQDIVRIVVFGRYSHQKNPIRFAEAMAMLKERIGCCFEVDWYGSQSGSNQGFNNEYLRVKECVERLKVDDVLHLKPSVKDPSLLMGNYHAACLPSLYEGFSNSIAEAISSGKPMLVSDVSDNSVMVHDGVNGYLFNPTNINSICDAFTRFLSLPIEEKRQMAEESRRIAEELFDKDLFIKKYIDLIEK